MATPRAQPDGLHAAVITMALIVTLVILTPRSAAVHRSQVTSNGVSLAQRKTVLGSRPPGCVNKCMNCRPCMATLVVPPHKNKGAIAKAAKGFTPERSSRGDDDTYYLLSWKCRCGNKLFQP